MEFDERGIPFGFTKADKISFRVQYQLSLYYPSVFCHEQISTLFACLSSCFLFRPFFLSLSPATQYAKWEAAQHEFDRARSIWERCLDIDYTNVLVWQKYAEMEMANRFVNRARNVFDRVVALLPRVEVFWYKYSHMEVRVWVCRALTHVMSIRDIFL
jgi:hypothetical protein